MEEASARRERLKALKAAAAAAAGDAPPDGVAPGTEQQQQEAEPEKPVLKFRNYVVKDTRIEHETVRGHGQAAAAGAGSGLQRRLLRARRRSA